MGFSFRKKPFSPGWSRVFIENPDGTLSLLCNIEKRGDGWHIPLPVGSKKPNLVLGPFKTRKEAGEAYVKRCRGF